MGGVLAKFYDLPDIRHNSMKKIMMLQKEIEDKNGKIIVRVMNNLEGAEKTSISNVAEMVTQGCVIGFWEVRLIDNTQWQAEFREVHDRLTSVKIEAENLINALYWGRRIADTVVDFYFNE